MNRKKLVGGISAATLAISITTCYTLAVKVDTLNETLVEKETVISDMTSFGHKQDGRIKQLKKDLGISIQENVDLKDGLEKMSGRVNTLKDDKNELQSQMLTIDKELKLVKTELRNAKKIKPVVASATTKKASASKEPSNVKRTITVTATAYTAYCKGCSGETSTGINLRKNPGSRVIAVDPSVIPMGSKLYLEGFGYATAADKGGAIKGNKVDVFIPDLNNARKFGVQTLKLHILN